jgi:transcriptional regulator with XRE-family HTH domain
MCNVMRMEKLATYLDSRNISQREFSRLLEVDPSIVSRLVRGQMRPSLDLAVRIEKLTKGHIKPSYWISIEGRPSAISTGCDALAPQVGGAA